MLLMSSVALLMLVLTFFLLMILGMPIAYNILVSSFVYVICKGIPLVIMGQKLYQGINNLALLAIPFFVITGQFMFRGGLLEDLVDLVNSCVGRAPGAIAVVAIGTSLLLGSIVGLAVATAVSLGTFLIPMMKKEGYSSAFSAGVMSSASLLGPIMPPSALMITYCIVAGRTSIAGMFIGAFVPAILITLAQITVVLVISKKRNYPSYPPTTWAQKWKALKKALPALMLPIIILGGIFGGICSVTEASGIAAIYSGILAILVKKNVNWKDFKGILMETVLSSGLTMILMGAGIVMSWAIANEALVGKLSAFLGSMPVPLFLLCVNIILIVAGMFMDDGANCIILGPIISTIAYNMGIEPIHIGLVIVINLVIGLATPPFGITLFVTSPIADTSIEETTKEALPLIIATFAVLLLITYVPDVCMFLPRLFNYA